MSLTATFDDTKGRVRLVVASAPTQADTALFERSTDGVTWTTVRGGSAVPLAGAACQLDDYEYPAGTSTTYRVSYVDRADPNLQGIGTAVTSNNAAVTPTIPAGLSAGDGLFALVSSRNTAATFSTTTPGWAKALDFGHIAIFTARYTATLANPVITPAGGSAGSDVIAQIVSFRNTETSSIAVGILGSNPSAQDIITPGATLTAQTMILVRAGWKPNTATDTTLSAATLLGETFSVAGSGSTQCWYVGLGSGAQPSRTITITGGVAAANKGLTLGIARAAYVTQETAVVMPAQTGTWLKNIGRAYLSTRVTVTDIGTTTTKARGGAIDILNRTYPVAVTDVRSGRELTLQVTTPTLQDAADLEARLAAGDVVFLQPPDVEDCPIPTGYFTVGDTARSQHSKRTVRRFFDLPLVEVAAPSSVIVPITATYQSVLSTYTTYAALLAGEPTYADVIDMTGVPDVVVP